MSRQTQLYHAQKFFGHMLPKYGVRMVQLILAAEGIPFEPFDP